MKVQELYEKQYGEKKLINRVSFSLLRKIFKIYDIHREDMVVSLLDHKADRLLDVGCGDGSLIFKLKDKFKELYGVDVSPSRIKEAEKKVKFIKDKKINFSIANIDEGLPFRDEMFDVVTCIAVLEHIFDPYFAAKEFNRVLKNNGILILEVPNIAYLKYRIQLLFGKLPVTSSPYNWKEIGWDGGHLHYFTKRSLRQLLEESGFKILKVSGSGLFAQFRNWWPSLFTGDLIIKAQKLEMEKN